MAKTKKEFLLARRKNDDLLRLPSEEYPEYNIVIDYLENTYGNDIIGCIIPEGYRVVIALLHDDQKNSRNDRWVFTVFDVSKDTGELGTITLDNLDKLESIDDNNEKEKLSIIKTINGNFEEIIQESISIIKKYKGNGQ